MSQYWSALAIFGSMMLFVFGPFVLKMVEAALKRRARRRECGREFCHSRRDPRCVTGHCTEHCRLYCRDWCGPNAPTAGSFWTAVGPVLDLNGSKKPDKPN